MTKSFLILFVTIKAEIALILQCVSINTHSVMTEKKILYISLIIFYHHSYTHLLFYLFLKKNIEGGKKKEKKTFSTVSLSLITTHIDTSHLYLYWKNKHNIRKGRKKNRKGEHILKLFKVRHSQFFHLLI